MSSTAYYEKIVQEDLNTGVSTATIRNPGGGTLTGTQISLSSLAVGQLKATASWTPGGVAASSYATTTVTVTGAALGDFAMASYSNSISYLNLSAAVTATNTVTVTLSNNGAAITPTAGTVAVLVFHAA
jgi:hypothetical protein